MLAPRACPQALAGARFFTLRECQVGLGYEAKAILLTVTIGLALITWYLPDPLVRPLNFGGADANNCENCVEAYCAYSLYSSRETSANSFLK
jgi:hypothetical protein